MNRIAALLLLALAGAANAADSNAKHLAADEVPAATYDVFTDETLVRYTVDHLGYNDYWGTFAGATGTLTIDPRDISSTKVEIAIPIFQLETTNRDLNAELYSSQFFDYIRFREMRFVSTEVKRTGPKTATLIGNLTIRDVTKPLTLDVTFHGAGPSPFGGDELFVGFDATGSVKRSDYGLGKWMPIVSDETRIFISAEFKKRS